MKLDKLGIDWKAAGIPAKLSQGYEFWRGPGIDGAPCVGIATSIDIESKNSKTGPMIQTYVMRADDISPYQSVLSGADAAVCGDCPLRPITAKATGGAECYVASGYHTRNTLESVYRAFRNGSYPRIDPEVLGDIIAKLGMSVRQGAWGGPDVVPTAVWAALDRGRGTSYTHQWRTADSGLMRFAMASVQNLDEAAEAQAMGWRTYRVDLESVGPQAGEIWCPEQTRGVQCNDCGLCSGTRHGGGGKNIVITPIESKPAKARRMAAQAVAA